LAEPAYEIEIVSRIAAASMPRGPPGAPQAGRSPTFFICSRTSAKLLEQQLSRAPPPADSRRRGCTAGLRARHVGGHGLRPIGKHRSLLEKGRRACEDMFDRVKILQAAAWIRAIVP